MQRWIICEVWPSLNTSLGEEILMLCSWWLGNTNRCIHDLPRLGTHHRGSLYIDRGYIIILLNMDARITLHEAMGAKAVCCTPPRPSFSALTPHSIIRILFMIPVYAVASFLSFWWYWHAIYFEVISDCYEAFAIASFFALLCHYIAPNLHDQKAYFRGIQPKGWIIPISTMKKCCGGERGPWRTPRSGLTWFNIIWTGIYQYCFIRVTMTVTAVLTQYFGKYCESSNSPLFAHIWVCR